MILQVRLTQLSLEYDWNFKSNWNIWNCFSKAVHIYPKSCTLQVISRLKMSRAMLLSCWAHFTYKLDRRIYDACGWLKRWSLQWRHNGHEGVSNQQTNTCILIRLFRRRAKKKSKLRVTGLCAVNSPVNSPHTRPVTLKMFPFDDVIMYNM